MIKRNSIIINTSRGEIVNEKFLINEMNKKNIKYYTDVISDENNLKKNIFSQIKNRNLFFYSNHQAGLSIESTSKTDKFIINKFTDIWKKIKN